MNGNLSGTGLLDASDGAGGFRLDLNGQPPAAAPDPTATPPRPIPSASPIPGNEEYVARTVDNLFKLGANVYYHANKRAHVSGHA